MYTAALTVLLAAGACGECRRDDCGQCYRPVYSFQNSFYSFFCNLAPPCDCRMQQDYWPLEYPGARARGWQSHRVAVTRDTPINVGPHAVPVVYDEHGIPKVLGYTNDAEMADRTPSPAPAEPVAPSEPDAAAGANAGGRERASLFQSSWKFLRGSDTSTTR